MNTLSDAQLQKKLGLTDVEVKTLKDCKIPLSRVAEAAQRYKQAFREDAEHIQQLEELNAVRTEQCTAQALRTVHSDERSAEFARLMRNVVGSVTLIGLALIVSVYATLTGLW